MGFYQKLGDDIGRCGQQLASLKMLISQEAGKAYEVQRRLLENDVAVALALNLLTSWQRRGTPLRVQEKLNLLAKAVADFRERLRKLWPALGEESFEQQVEALEARLSELQFNIEGSPAGRQVQKVLKYKQPDRLLHVQENLGLS